MNKYQIMPSLTPEERATLKADIAARGVCVPIEFDESGEVLDGHNRKEIYEELVAEGYKLPAYDRIIRKGMTEEQKRDYVIALNLKRRHLSKDQRNQLLLSLRLEGKSYSALAEMAGVSIGTAHNAVQAAADATDTLALPQATLRKDGLYTPSSLTPRQIISGEKAIKLERAKAREVLQNTVPEWMPTHTERFVLLQGDFTQIDLPEGSVDAIITDPPYPREFLPLYESLAKYASKVLVPNGLLIVMVGHQYLPEVVGLMSQHITYHWTLAWLMGGATASVWDRHAFVGWKPVLLFTKGPTEIEWFYDVIKSEGRDKRYHHWGQDAVGFGELIRTFTLPGDTILDPFLGGGTTGEAALRLNRQFVGIDVDQKAIDTSRGRLNKLIMELGEQSDEPEGDSDRAQDLESM